MQGSSCVVPLRTSVPSHLSSFPLSCFHLPVQLTSFLALHPLTLAPSWPPKPTRLQYNKGADAPGLKNYQALIPMRGTLQGFIILDYAHRFREAEEQLAKWIAEGKIKVCLFFFVSSLPLFRSFLLAFLLRSLVHRRQIQKADEVVGE